MARVEIKTNAQLQQMARAGVITSRALDAAVAAARPGVTTAEVNAAFERTMLELGGTSNFYGYYDYPATVCTSVNHEVVHGIPRRLRAQGRRYSLHRRWRIRHRPRHQPPVAR